MSCLLTIREVATHLRVSERTVRKRVGTGALAAVKLGPEPHAPVRIEPEALEAFLRPATTKKETR